MRELNRRANRRFVSPDRRCGDRRVARILVLSTASPGGAVGRARRTRSSAQQVQNFCKISASGNSVTDNLKVANADAKALKKVAKSRRAR